MLNLALMFLRQNIQFLLPNLTDHVVSVDVAADTDHQDYYAVKANAEN